MAEPSIRDDPGSREEIAATRAAAARPLAVINQFNPFRVLITHANFRRFWIGQTLSLVGTWMQSMALGWLALELSNNAFIVGLVSAAGSLPILLLSLHAGVLVDRSDKLRLVQLAQTFLLIEAVLLWWLTWTGHINIALLLVLALFGGIVTSAEIPARQSLMIDLVGRDDLRDAIALNSSGFNLARIVGPSFAAFVIAHAGIAWCFAVNAFSFFTVLVGLWRVELPTWRPPERTSSPLDGIREGLTYVKNERRLFGIVELVTAYSILGTPFLALMPVVAREMLGLGAAGYGVLLSAVGIGGLTGALTLAAVGSRAGRGTLLTAATYLLPVVLLLLSVTRNPGIAYALVTLAGFTMIVHGAVANGLLQTLVPDEFRGRLMSIYSLIVVGLPQVVGAFAAGVVARLIGIDWAIGGGAAIMLFIGWRILRRYPELRRL